MSRGLGSCADSIFIAARSWASHCIGLGSKTVLNTGSRRPTWGLGGSGGPGPRSTAQPEYQGAAAPAAGGGARDSRATSTSRAAWPRSASPHLVTPRAFAPAFRPRASPRHVPHLGTEAPAVARAVQTLCVRATACVRGPESRARPCTTQTRARRICPASSSPAAGGSRWRRLGMGSMVPGCLSVGPEL